MKVLIVASINKGYYAPFIIEQADALKRQGIEINFFGIEGKGIKGYLREYSRFRRLVNKNTPDIIHAHYGLSGLLAALQRKVPVVTTYHGSDINEPRVLPFSRLAMLLSSYNIFVSEKIQTIAHPRRNFTLLPCGVDLNSSQLYTKKEARDKAGLAIEGHYILFAGSFDNRVKNSSLAKVAVSLVPDAELLELKGYNREQVNLLMCAADALLMTSFSEGSPQVVKEAMACGCPVVSVDVGDVKDVIEKTEGCFITGKSAEEIAKNLIYIINRGIRTEGRKVIIERQLCNDQIAAKLISLYNSIL